MSDEKNSKIHPTQIAVHQKTRQFEIHFNDGSEFNLPSEYLRVFSPSAEVRVAKSRGELIRGKERVNIDNIEPMGSYAIRIVFDDGHDTGVYSWSTLKDLADNFEANWDHYKQQLAEFHLGNTDEGKVSLLFFIDLVEALGAERLEMDLSKDIQQVSDVIQQLVKKDGKLKQALNPERLTITVNKQFTTVDQKLFNGDEIALTPRS